MSIDVARAIELAQDHLFSLRRPDLHYEGFLDSGISFDAGDLVLWSFLDEGWPIDPQRLEGRVRHVLSGQHDCGLFQLYPGGPCSKEATRIALLGLGCAERAGERTLAPDLLAQWGDAQRRARAALDGNACPSREVVALTGYRFALEALDANAPRHAGFLPDPRIALLAPTLLFDLVPAALRRRFDRVLYPFVEELPELLSWCTVRCLQTTRGGQVAGRFVASLPQSFRRLPVDRARRAARSFLARQDATGAFYYSPSYTLLFVAALGAASEMAEDPELRPAVTAATERALGYVRSREVALPSGIASSFLASDVWDSAAVAMGLLQATQAARLHPRIAELVAYVLNQQSSEGGFSYGRGSHFPDCDTTGLAVGLLSSTLLNGAAPAQREESMVALAKGLRFLLAHRTSNGGFGAWGHNDFEPPPEVPPELSSLLLDVSTPDVTARVMVSLDSTSKLLRADAEVANRVGVDQQKIVETVRTKGLRFLLSTRDAGCGLWRARWSMGYVIGSRFVFDALATFALPTFGSFARAAGETLISVQNDDGGFGESEDSDLSGNFTPSRRSTALTTGAALGILRYSDSAAASEAADRAARYLIENQHPDGSWTEASLYTQFDGVYARYQLMTQVALLVALYREQQTEHVSASVAP